MNSFTLPRIRIRQQTQSSIIYAREPEFWSDYSFYNTNDLQQNTLFSQFDCIESQSVTMNEYLIVRKKSFESLEQQLRFLQKTGSLVFLYKENVIKQLTPRIPEYENHDIFVFEQFCQHMFKYAPAPPIRELNFKALVVEQELYQFELLKGLFYNPIFIQRFIEYFPDENVKHVMLQLKKCNSFKELLNEFYNYSQEDPAFPQNYQYLVSNNIFNSILSFAVFQFFKFSQFHEFTTEFSEALLSSEEIENRILQISSEKDAVIRLNDLNEERKKQCDEFEMDFEIEEEEIMKQKLYNNEQLNLNRTQSEKHKEKITFYEKQMMQIEDSLAENERKFAEANPEYCKIEEQIIRETEIKTNVNNELELVKKEADDVNNELLYEKQEFEEQKSEKEDLISELNNEIERFDRQKEREVQEQKKKVENECKMLNENLESNINALENSMDIEELQNELILFSNELGCKSRSFFIQNYEPDNESDIREILDGKYCAFTENLDQLEEIIVYLEGYIQQEEEKVEEEREDEQLKMVRLEEELDDLKEQIIIENQSIIVESKWKLKLADGQIAKCASTPIPLKQSINTVAKETEKYIAMQTNEITKMIIDKYGEVCDIYDILSGRNQKNECTFSVDG